MPHKSTSTATPAGTLPVTDVKVRLRATVPLDVAVPEERAKEADCPNNEKFTATNSNTLRRKLQRA
jgi:hypothetical protein